MSQLILPGNSGGSITPGWRYSIDTPPSNPSIYDDEFESTKLDPKWTLRSASYTITDGAFISGTIDQPVNTAGASSITIIAHVFVENFAENYNGSFISLIDEASGNANVLRLEHNNSWKVLLQRYNNFPNLSFVSTVATRDWLEPRAYVKLLYNIALDRVYAYASRTGRLWNYIGSDSLHIGRVDRVGLDSSVEWFRVEIR